MKRTLITGGAIRIGAEIAKNLASKGYNILLHYNNSEMKAKALQEHIIKDYGVECDIFQANFSKMGFIEIFESQIAKYDDLQILINNASFFQKSNIVTMTEEQYEKDFNIHVKAPLFISQKFASNCKGEGVIINIIDKTIRRAKTQYFSYLLSKKSLADLTQMLAIALAPNIRVNGICPIHTIDASDNSTTDSYVNKIKEQIPLKRIGEIDDILKAIDFLINNDFMTGELLFIDGGSSIIHGD